jgi:hypothetical protein
MPKLDLVKVKREVSFPALMQHYNFQLRPAGPHSFRGKCPLPTHSNPKDDNSFTATLKDVGWVFDCFSSSCIAARAGKKGGNIIDWLMAMTGETSVFKAASALNDMFGLNAWLLNGNGSPESGGRGGSAPRTSKEPEKTEVSAPQPKQSETGCNTNRPLAEVRPGFTGLQGINPEHPLIQGTKQISVATARSFGVGFFPGKGSMAGRVVFPLHTYLGDATELALIGYLGRAVEEVEPKWLMGKGVVKNFLYELQRCDPAKPLIVCESTWTVLWRYQNGIQAAALMGSEMTDAQEACLAPFKTLILAMDNDAVGRAKAKLLAERLRRNHAVTKAFLKE